MPGRGSAEELVVFIVILVDIVTGCDATTTSCRRAQTTLSGEARPVIARGPNPAFVGGRTTSESDRGRGQRAERAQHRTCSCGGGTGCRSTEELPRKFKERAVGAGVPVVSVHSTRRRARRCWSSWMCTPGGNADSAAAWTADGDQGLGLGWAEPTSQADLPIRWSERNPLVSVDECLGATDARQVIEGRQCLGRVGVGTSRLSEPSRRRRLPRRSLSIGPGERRDLRRFARAPLLPSPRVALAPCLQRGSVDVGAAPERLRGPAGRR